MPMNGGVASSVMVSHGKGVSADADNDGSATLDADTVGRLGERTVNVKSNKALWH